MTARACDPRRRLLLTACGGLLLSLTVLRRASAADEFTIRMAGTASGSHVWFRPRGLWLPVGHAVRWVNTDAGNVHTVTAYHPDNHKPLRIPAQARPWDSGYLMPDESFVMVFDVPGVYDYFCVPHEQAGMVGRIIVGDVDASARPYADTDGSLAERALSGFPPVDQILEHRQIE